MFFFTGLIDNFDLLKKGWLQSAINQKTFTLWCLESKLQIAIKCDCGYDNIFEFCQGSDSDGRKKKKKTKEKKKKKEKKKHKKHKHKKDKEEAGEQVRIHSLRPG